jgi:hypothetical protein
MALAKRKRKFSFFRGRKPLAVRVTESDCRLCGQRMSKTWKIMRSQQESVNKFDYFWDRDAELRV